MPSAFLKVVACEIAFREICHCAARSPSLLDLEFVTQGLHDRPRAGAGELQARIDAVPADRYDAILVGYALCGHLIRGLTARHTRLVVPRAHDCIAFFLGSRERHQECLEKHPGTYFYSSGWLECLRKRGEGATPGSAMFLPGPAGGTQSVPEEYERWVARYGEEKARFLLGELEGWKQHYRTGALIDFEFARPLGLDQEVRSICEGRGWEFRSLPGDLTLLQRWLDGPWPDSDFLVVEPGHHIVPSYDERVIAAAPVPA